MQLVIDTSALLAVIANEPERPALISATTGAQLLAPASLPWEVGNAFSAMLKRRRISLPQASAALRAYRAIPIRLVAVALEDALQTASDLNVYAYDAYFLVSARVHDCELLTLDRGLRRAARRAGVAVKELNR